MPDFSNTQNAGNLSVETDSRDTLHQVSNTLDSGQLISLLYIIDQAKTCAMQFGPWLF